jgi:hypothetical protein
VRERAKKRLCLGSPCAPDRKTDRFETILCVQATQIVPANAQSIKFRPTIRPLRGQKQPNKSTIVDPFGRCAAER